MFHFFLAVYVLRDRDLQSFVDDLVSLESPREARFHFSISRVLVVGFFLCTKKITPWANSDP